jgi:CPA1 family monovalent cation:H+ antiporter
LISAATRLQGIFFWDFLIYVIEGMIFLLTGLQARTLIVRIAGHPLRELVVSAAVTSLVVIATRFIWMYPATYIPRWIPSIRRKDPAPPWQWPFALAFTGVRGLVSLAAALAIPLTIENGNPFPYRDLILFLTFIVILVTLIGQGLALPAVIRALGLANQGRREHDEDREHEFEARRMAIEATLARLDEIAVERRIPEDVSKGLRAHLQGRLRQVLDRSDGDADHGARSRLVDDMELELLGAERETVNDLYQDGKLTAEARLRIERELDLREARIHSLLAGD